MLVHAHGFAINRGIADHVHVELDVRVGLPAFSVIGLGAGAARDARERVQAAVLNSGFGFPRKRLTVNLAPAAAGRGAPAFDLALACCVLAVQEEIDAARLSRVGLFAELGLGGDLRPCQCVAAAAEAAQEACLAGLIVACADLREARTGRGALRVAGLGTLREVAALLSSEPAAGSRAPRAPAAVRAPARSAAPVARGVPVVRGAPASMAAGAGAAATRGPGRVSSAAGGARAADAIGRRGGPPAGARGAPAAARGAPAAAAIGRREGPSSSSRAARPAPAADPVGGPGATPRAPNNARPP